MQKPLLAALLLGTLLAARPAAAAPIEIVARLDPGQSGPVYSWSLRISTDPGYEVGAVTMLTSGFENFVPNTSLPLDLGFPPFVTDPLGDGRSVVVLINPENGIAIVDGGSTDVLLGTLYGPSTTSPPVILWDSEYELGGTVFDAYLNPATAKLTAYPVASFSLAAIGVPEPETAVLVGLLLAALRTARRRAA